MELHKLQVVIESNIGDLKKGMSEAKAEVRKAVSDMRQETDKAVKPISMKYDSSKTAKIKQDLYKLKGELDRLKQQEEYTPKELPTARYRRLQEEIDRTIDKEAELKAKEDILNNTPLSRGTANALKKLQDEFQATEAKLENLIAKSKEMEMSGTAYSPNRSYLTLQDRIASTMDKIAIKQDALNRSQPDGSKYKGFLGTLEKIKSTISRIKSGGSSFKDILGNFKLLSGGIGDKVVKTLTSVGRAARLMIRRMLIRNTIRQVIQGFKDLYAAGGTTASNMLTLRNSLVGLRGAFASAFAPILNFVTPALNYLIGVLTSACNALARFFAFLTGQPTYTVAKAATSGFEGAGAAADGANKKAKEYKKTLLGFDQINKLDEQPDDSGGGGSGGGGGAGGGGAIFEEVATGYSKLADMIKKAWAGGGDFTKVGYEVAERLANALEKIPWRKIKANAEKIGKSIATFINGACSNIRFWKDVGTTIGEGINTAISFSYGFFTNIDFYKVTVAITTAISDAIKKIDSKKIAKTLASVIKGILAIDRGIFDGVDFEGIGKWMGETIINGVKELLKTLPEVIGMMLSMPSNIKRALRDFGRGLLEGIIKELTGKDIDLRILPEIKLPWERGKFLEWAFGAVGKTIKAVIDVVSGKKSWKDVVFGKGKNEGKGTASIDAKKGKLSWKDILFGKGKTEGKGNVGINAKKGKVSIFDILFGFGKKEGTTNTKVNAVKGSTTVKDVLFGKGGSGEYKAKIGLKKGWKGSFANALGLDKAQTVKAKLKRDGDISKSLGLNKTQSTKVKMSPTQSAKTALGLNKTQSTKVKLGLSGSLKKSLGLNKTYSVSIKTKKLSPHWTTATKGKTTMSYIDYFYKQGGFPEEGPFFMNRGEIAGKFSNGKGVVANNEQITEGIARAVAPAVYNAMMKALSTQSGGGQTTVVLQGDADKLFKVVQEKADRYVQRTGQPAFSI